ncbi:substrate-binding domain-containing protein [Candidatus Enterococcus ferrettii]|uniref:LacI family transcriptional regulator n=1 Tax=Candidatus Enterococcus ferrettii TaxID=2815324 RepID=A0ABV0ELS6_9ENTE
MDKKNTIFISSNHYQGAFEATETLIQNGVTHPVIVMHKRKSPSAKERYNGFKDALKKNNFSFDTTQSVFITDVLSEQFNSELTAFLTANPDTDGLFAINDLIALELIVALKRMHKDVPSEIKIIGFDDMPQDRYSSPTLSSIKQDTDTIAFKAVENLINLIDNKTETGQSIVVPVSLVLRESTEK